MKLKFIYFRLKPEPKRYLAFCFFLFFFSGYAFAQDHLWSLRAGSSGTVGQDNGYGVVTDNQGNVYVTGCFSGVVDFDAGPGTFTLASSGGTDAFVLKTNSQGNFIWVVRLGGSMSDAGYAIALDNTGNVCVTGWFTGTVDFDPGVGTYTLNTVPTSACIFKLNTSGGFIWARNFNSAMNNFCNDIACDTGGNIYLTGNFNGLTDFDPGPGTFTYNVSGGVIDGFITKLDAGGNLLWVRQLRSSNSTPAVGAACIGKKVAVDGNGNICVAGNFVCSADLDPSAANLWFASQNNSTDVFILKLDAAGNFVWANTVGSDMLDEPSALTFDSNNNVCIGGWFTNTADFNPGPGTYTLQPLTPIFSHSGFVLILNTAGNFMNAFVMGKQVTGIKTTAAGHIYISGYFSGAYDFDPGAATYTLAPSSSGETRAFVVNLGPGNTFNWARGTQGSNCDVFATSLALEGTSDVLLTGYFNSYGGNPDFDPGPSVKTLVNAGNSDVFVLKLGLCPAIPLPSVISGSTAICKNSKSTYSHTPLAGADGYNWKVFGGSGISAGQGSNSVSVLFAGAQATVVFTPTNYCSSGSSSSLVVNILPLPNVGIVALPSASVPAGSTVVLSGTGAQSYSWTGGVQNGVPFFPATNGVYTVTGQAANGCTNINSVLITVNALLSVNGEKELAGVYFYPNPTSNTITWQLTNYHKKLECNIVDVTGKPVLKAEINNLNLTTDLSELPPGVYYMVLSHEPGKRYKLIKH